MERDEVYVPKTRTDLGIPHKSNHEIEWDELFGDTPIYTFYMLVHQQLLAFPAYLCKDLLVGCLAFGLIVRPAVFNVSGQKDYPAWTNHFDR